MADKTELIADITERIPDNTTRLVSPADVRESIIDVVNAAPVISGTPASGDFLSYSPTGNWHPISPAELVSSLSGVSGVSQSEFDDHVNDTNNPHSVTADQLGLGTMALQDASGVSISGGQINNTAFIILADGNTPAQGQLSFDANANTWDVDRGSIQYNDGVQDCYVVGFPVSSVPSNGQVLKYSTTSGTIEWANESGGSLDPDLDALAALSGTGFAVRTGSNTWAQRSIASSTNITVNNSDGVAGNPSPILDNDITLVGEATYVGTTSLRLFGNNADVSLYNTEVVINDSSLDVNFRVEGNNNANLIFTDAGLDRVGIGINDPGTILQIGPSGTGAGQTGAISLRELAANGSNYVGFKAPDNIATNLLFTLPSGDGGNGQILHTDGVGGLYWGEDFAGSGAISDGDKGDLTISGSGSVFTINSNIVTFDKFQQIGSGNLIGRFSSGSGNVEAINISADIQSFLAAANDGAARTDLGLAIGSDVQAYNANLTTYAGIAPSANVQTLLGSANYADFRIALGLVVGTDVQAFDADLTALAALASTGLAVRTASNTWAQRTITGTANQITVGNGDGVSGNPTLSLPTTLNITDLSAHNSIFNSVGTSGISFFTPDAQLITFTAPSTGGDLNFVLPNEYGTSGYALKTDGVGGLYWDEDIEGSGGTIGIDQVGPIGSGNLVGRFSSGSGNLETISASLIVQNFIGVTTVSGAQGILELIPGTDIQVYSSNLDLFAAITPTTAGSNILLLDNGASGQVLKTAGDGNVFWGTDVEGTGGGSISFGADNQIPYTNSSTDDFDYSSSFTFNGSLLSVDGAATFNEAGADVDFRVEGDTNPNLLFIDGSTDRVSIGNNSPSGLLHVGSGIPSFAGVNDVFITNHLEVGSSVISPLFRHPSSVSLSGGGNELVIGSTNADFNIGIGDNVRVRTNGASTVFNVNSIGNLDLNTAQFSNGGVTTVTSSTSTDTVLDVFNANLVRGAAPGAPGLGLGYSFAIENNGSSVVQAGKFEFLWTSAAAGAEEASFIQKVRTGGVVRDRFIVHGSGATLPSGTFLFLENTSHDHVGFKAPDSISSNLIWTLPGADGVSGQVIKTDGNGELYWDDDIEGSGGGGNELGTNLSSSTNEILSNTGSIILGGSGGTWNEALQISFEVNNGVALSSTTGATQLYFSTGFNPVADFMGLRDPDINQVLRLKSDGNLDNARDLTFNVGNANRTITINGNPTLDDWFNQNVKSTASPTFAGATFSGLTASRVVLTGASKELSSGATAPSGDFVGTTDTQTLTNKTIDGALNTLVIANAMIPVVMPETPVASGDYVFFPAPPSWSGRDISDVSAFVAASGDGTTTIQITRLRGDVEVLSTPITIDGSEISSDTADVAAVINTSNDDVAAYDIYKVEVIGVPGTPPEGLYVQISSS